MKLQTTFELAEGRVFVFAHLKWKLERTAQLFEEVGRLILFQDCLLCLWNIEGGFKINLLSFLINLLIHLEYFQVDLRMLGLFGLATENFVDLSFILLSQTAV